MSLIATLFDRSLLYLARNTTANKLSRLIFFFSLKSLGPANSSHTPFCAVHLPLSTIAFLAGGIGAEYDTTRGQRDKYRKDETEP